MTFWRQIVRNVRLLVFAIMDQLLLRLQGSVLLQVCKNQKLATESLSKYTVITTNIMAFHDTDKIAISGSSTNWKAPVIN